MMLRETSLRTAVSSDFYQTNNGMPRKDNTKISAPIGNLKYYVVNVNIIALLSLLESWFNWDLCFLRVKRGCTFRVCRTSYSTLRWHVNSCLLLCFFVSFGVLLVSLSSLISSLDRVRMLSSHVENNWNVFIVDFVQPMATCKLYWYIFRPKANPPSQNQKIDPPQFHKINIHTVRFSRLTSTISHWIKNDFEYQRRHCQANG